MLSLRLFDLLTLITLFYSLTKILRGGSIPSLIFLDVRGNPISSKTHDLLDKIQHVCKILKIYHDSDTLKDREHLSKLDEEVGTERAVNLYRSKWAECFYTQR